MCVCVCMCFVFDSLLMLLLLLNNVCVAYIFIRSIVIHPICINCVESPTTKRVSNEFRIILMGHFMCMGDGVHSIRSSRCKFSSLCFRPTMTVSKNMVALLSQNSTNTSTYVRTIYSANAVNTFSIEKK